MTQSEAIDSVIENAISDENKVLDITTGWTKVRAVIRMELPLSTRVREIFDKNNRLRSWSSEGTPHNRAEEGYTDDIDQIAISFPK